MGCSGKKKVNNLPLLDFAVHGGPFLIEDRQAVLSARATDHVVALKHPVDGILHICVCVDLRVHLTAQLLLQERKKRLIYNNS